MRAGAENTYTECPLKTDRVCATKFRGISIPEGRMVSISDLRVNDIICAGYAGGPAVVVVGISSVLEE